MTTRAVNTTSRRFLRQALKSLTSGRLFGSGRHGARSLQASTTSVTPVALGAAFTHHDVTTDASGLARVVNVGVAGPFYTGQRKVVRLATRAGGSDTFTMDAASLARSTGAPVTSLTFSAAGQTAYIEWSGAKWVILATTAALV